MKKKKKGFTLIELLAIIVILAIIAVITVPIILNIIENSKRGAVIDSAYGYKDSINKYYVTELANNPEFALSDGKYTVGDDGSITSGENKYEIPFTGTKPSGGKVTLKDNVVTDACLVIDDYAVELKDGKFTTDGKGDCNGSLVGGNGEEQGDDPSVSEPQSFATDSWETIVDAVKNDNTGNYKVGDTKTVDLGELGQRTLRIANTSTPEDCQNSEFSQTACGFVLEFADIITNHEMNPPAGVDEFGDEYGTNKGGWRDSEMRKYLNCSTSDTSLTKNDNLSCNGFDETTIYDLLPEELKKAIIDTRVVSGHGSSDLENFTTTDKIYLLATAEIWENGSDNTIEDDTARDKTRQLDYYKDVTTNSFEKVIKSKSEWWLRSAYSSNSTSFMSVYGVGCWSGYYSHDANGVSPAFRIGNPE